MLRRTNWLDAIRHGKRRGFSRGRKSNCRSKQRNFVQPVVSCAIETCEERTLLSVTPTLTTTPGPTLTFGSDNLTDSATLSGAVNPTGTITFKLLAPDGTTVALNSVTVSGNGTYNVPNGFFPTVAGTYQWQVNYSGDSNNDPVSPADPEFETVDKAIPVLAVVLPPDFSGTYTGSPIVATVTITGVIGGVDDTPSTTLEGVGLTLSYFEGGDTSGTELTDPPTDVGTYTVETSFAGSQDYAGVSETDTFTIDRTSPRVFAAAAPMTLTFGDGSRMLAAAVVSGAVNPTGSMTFNLVGPDGTSIVDSESLPVDGPGQYETPTGYLPTAAGSYQWTAHYSGDANNNPASFAGFMTSETVNKARATLTVSDPDGTYTGNPFAATASVAGVLAGVDSAPSGTLEGVSPTFNYFVGTDTSGSELSGAPTDPGTYTVEALFAGSADYKSADATATFTISPATPLITSIPGDTVVFGSGEKLTDTATLSGGVNPTGTITFTLVAPDGTTVLDTESLPVNGDGTYATSFLPSAPRNYEWTVTYSGDLDNSPYVPSTSLSTVASFDGDNGRVPVGLSIDAFGNLYGTTQNGGPDDDGTVFEVPRGSSQIVRLAEFNGLNGQFPEAGVIIDNAGNLFGTTSEGGTGGDGTVFELPAGGGEIIVLANFDGSNGTSPETDLIPDGEGNLYGAALNTVFEVVKDSGQITTLATFNNGVTPSSNLFLDPAGNLYGTTIFGGPNDGGAIFEIVRGSGEATTIATLDSINGKLPVGDLVVDDAGNLFGTALDGGPNNDGLVFEVTPSSGAITTVAAFNGSNGSLPSPGLISDQAGNLYGTAEGPDGRTSVFEIVKGSGQITLLTALDGNTAESVSPGLVIGSAGDLYGVTFSGGTEADGAVFRLIDHVDTVGETVVTATPTLIVTDDGGTYTASRFGATVTVAGVQPGVDDTPSSTLEGVAPTLTYFAGPDVSGTELTGPPIIAGTYTVEASFDGSQDYASASVTATFTIAPAPPTVNVTDASGIFTGNPFQASATATGLGGASVSGTFAFTYYVGSGVSGAGSSVAPMNPGTYTVVAAFTSTDSNYADAESDPLVFTIEPAGPAIMAPPSASLNENSSQVFSAANGNAISFTDVNAGTSRTESLSLSVGHGTLTLGSTSGLTFKAGKNNSAALTVTGTVTNLNAALNGLAYQPTAVYWGPDSLAVSVADPGDGQSASTNVALTVIPLSPPTISAPDSGSVGENLSLTFSTASDNAISLADANAGTKAQTLTLAVSNGTLTLGATPGLTFKSGKNGTATFSISATLASLNTALNGLIYKPTLGYAGSDSLTASLLDPADGQSASTGVALNVIAAAAPSITAPASASLNENSSRVFSAANGNAISFTDVNAGTSKTESLTLSVSHGTLKLATTSGLTVTSGANNSASMTVTGTVTNLNAALNGLAYQPTAVYWGPDSLTVSVADPGDGQSASTNVALTVNPLSPPTISAPDSGSLGENLSLTFSPASGNAISLADANAGTKAQILTLAVSNGTLTLGATPGLTFNSGKNGTATFSISATLANLNTALNGLLYKPTIGYAGSDSLTVSILDPADGQSASTGVALNIIAAAAPTITAPATASLNENSSQVFSAANGNAISFTDVNAGTGKTESLTLSVSHGTLKLATTSGLTVTSGANNSASMTVTGTVTNLNAALSGLTYKPTVGYSGADSLAVSVADPEDGQSASLGVALTVNILSPQITGPATASVAENGSLVFSAANGDPISIADVNPGNAVEQLTLMSTEGTIKLGSTAGITFVSGTNKSSSMTISGTLTNLNNALKNLTFTPTTGFVGPASISLTYADVGNGLAAATNVAMTVGNAGAAIPVNGPIEPPAPAAVNSASESAPSQFVGPMESDNSASRDSQNQWAGFAAALESLNS
jgi:uncharacterized repeat protein (TIGR03803 family)